MYDFLNQPIITSALCFQRDADSFFNPTGLGHTGFAFDGNSYTSGVLGEGQASWFTESQSGTRGPSSAFPTQILVLVGRASLTLLDATTDNLNLWMLFYFADQNAFGDNTQGTVSGFIAANVTWTNGLLTVALSPDPGSPVMAAVSFTFDFVQDAVYFDTTVNPAT